jgi:hypothetical protein
MEQVQDPPLCQGTETDRADCAPSDPGNSPTADVEDVQAASGVDGYAYGRIDGLLRIRGAKHMGGKQKPSVKHM